MFSKNYSGKQKRTNFKIRMYFWDGKSDDCAVWQICRAY